MVKFKLFFISFFLPLMRSNASTYYYGRVADPSNLEIYLD